MFIPIHQVKQYNAKDEVRFKDRWHTTEEGRNAHKVIIDLIRQGGGEDFLQWAIEGDKINRNFLENDKELKGISIREESIDFPTNDNFEDIDLSYAYLSELRFNNCCFGGTHGNFVTFNKCNFYKCLFHFSVWLGCSFKNCHFENVDFIQGGRFENCDFTGTKFTNVFFHDNLFDNCRFSANVELSPQRFKPMNEAWGATFDKINTVNFYLAIRDAYKEGGAHNEEWNYYYKSRCAVTRYNTKGFWEKCKSRVFSEWLIGYGEKPFNSLIVSVFVIALFGLLYMFTGLVFSIPNETGEIHDGIIKYDIKNIRQYLSVPSSYWQYFKDYCHFLYFSIVTFTTVGYGDIRPINPIGKFLSATEMLLGVTLIGAWVATFFRKLAR